VQLKSEAKRKGMLASSLAAATCSLLGTAAPAPTLAQAEASKWNFDTALLSYGEQQGRVTDLSGSVLVERRFPNRRLLSLRLSVDTLTGASASGAVPALTAQTFTSPSGNASYTTGAGEIPLDPTFLDTRIALGGDFAQDLGRRGRLGYGLSFSTEYDYLHTGAHANYTRNFNERNTTLEFGFALASDSIDPVGGAPRPLAAMLPEGQTGSKLGGESKTVLDLLIGVTQVLGPRTLAQLNYSMSDSSEYLTDPYKLVSVVDADTGDPVPASGDLNLVLYESRPDARLQHALFMRIKRQVRRADVLDASYRFMTDDWGVQSHTVDLRYRWPIGRSYLQPHIRYYLQSAADFYAPYLRDDLPLPEHASADHRLGELDAITLGLKYGLPFGDGQEWSTRVEYYSQSGTSPPEAGIGSLGSLELIPSLDALIVQVGYRF
jgi:hypothetical protein